MFETELQMQKEFIIYINDIKKRQHYSRRK